MDDTDGIYVREIKRTLETEMETNRDVLSNKRRRNDSSDSTGLAPEEEDNLDSAISLSDSKMLDIESQILPFGNKVPESISSELRIKHVDEECEEGDCLGGSIVTTKEGGTYSHVFQALSQTGILYLNFEIREFDVLLRFNDEDTDKLTHDEVVKKFSTLKTKEEQSIVTSNIEKGEVIRISFILVGYKPSNENVGLFTRTMTGIKTILKIRCKESYCYLSVQSGSQQDSLLFHRIQPGKGHSSHFIQEKVGQTQFALKTEQQGLYVGFKKGSSVFDEAFLLQNRVDNNYITGFDIRIDRDDRCFQFGFSANSDYYYLQMDQTNRRLVARQVYGKKLLAFTQRCSRY